MLKLKYTEIKLWIEERARSLATDLSLNYTLIISYFIIITHTTTDT